MRFATGAVLLALALALPAGAWAEEPEALLARAFSNLYADDYVQTMELTSGANRNRPVTRTLQITRKQSVQPGKALIRFLEPFDIRRTSVLILENEGENDDLFVYLPAVRLTRRLSAAQRADSFFGTDLSYEDVEPKHAGDYVVKRVAEDATASEGCTRLEIAPKESFESTYDKMISCIEPERAVIRWTDFYRHDKRVKRLEIDPAKVEPVGERAIPFLMTMRTLRTNSETQVATLSYDVAADIPDSLFSTWNLQAGDAERDRSKAVED